MIEYDGRPAHSWREFLNVPAVHIYESIGSTNDAARDLAEAGSPTLTVALTDRQTHGRGRGGKTWLSAPGASLIFSIIFRTPRSDQAAPGAAPIRIGNVVARAIEEVASARAMLKWPNDVVVDGHGKIAGILCESAVRREGIAYIIAGIGVNVSHVDDSYSSLREIAPRPVERGDLLKAIVDGIRVHADSVIAPLTDAEIAAIHARSILMNREIEAEDGTRGTVRAIRPDGSLQIETSGGMLLLHTATVRLANTGAYPGAHP